MSFALPPIPEVAVDAVLSHAEVSDPSDWSERFWAAGDLKAAWPILYAAAQRHAADTIDSTHAYEGGTGWDTNTDRLREMADEVAS